MFTTMFTTLITVLDPQTYGLNRAAVTWGLFALGGMVLIYSNLLGVLHAAGLPSVGN